MDTESGESDVSGVGAPPQRSRDGGRCGPEGDDREDENSSSHEDGGIGDQQCRHSTSSQHGLSFSIPGPAVHAPLSGFAPGENARRLLAGRENRVAVDVDTDIDIGAFVLKRSLGAGAPPLPIVIKFADVRYGVQVNRAASWSLETPLGSLRPPRFRKQILHGITGAVLPGEMLALMGPSGSGKTTFLNLLGGRALEKLQGTITYNDIPFCKPLKRRMGFVTQDDMLFPHLTVKETLVYAALLRLPETMTRDKRVTRAEEIILELGLDRCRDTMIGGPFLRGLSGGERKRVCIGHEILIDPSLLFLDEPTSGLDSTTAMRIVQVLQSISQAGRTVVTTIHQPSSRIFHMFDKLILLAEGHPVYSGKAADAVNFFESMGLQPMPTMNPADFLIDLAHGNVNDVAIPPELERMTLGTGHNPESSRRQTHPMPKDVIQFLIDCYEGKLARGERAKLAQIGKTTDELRSAVTDKRVWNTSWWNQFIVLLFRGFKERRHEYLSKFRFVQVLSASVVAGSLWFDSKLSTAEELQDQMGLVFFMTLFWGFVPLFTAIFTFPQERGMLAKERNADMYRLSAYFMSRTLGDLPLDLAMPTIFLIIVYFMANLRMAADAFFLTLVSVFLIVVTSQGLGLFIGASVMELKRATTTASVIVLSFTLAGGYFVQRIPVFIQWLRYISLNNYAYKLLLKVQYDRNQTVNCMGAGGCINVGDTPAFHGITLGGGAYEAQILLSMVVGYRLLTYIALRRMKTGTL